MSCGRIELSKSRNEDERVKLQRQLQSLRDQTTGKKKREAKRKQQMEMRKQMHAANLIDAKTGHAKFHLKKCTVHDEERRRRRGTKREKDVKWKTQRKKRRRQRKRTSKMICDLFVSFFHGVQFSGCHASRPAQAVSGAQGVGQAQKCPLEETQAKHEEG